MEGQRVNSNTDAFLLTHKPHFAVGLLKKLAIGGNSLMDANLDGMCKLIKI